MFLVGAAVAVPAASATVDLNGLFRASVYLAQPSLSFDDVCSLTVSQDHTALSISGPCEGAASTVSLSGTIDPGTGAFAVAGSAGPCSTLTVTGTALQDATGFRGAFTCATISGTGGVTAHRCGNGQLDP